MFRELHKAVWVISRLVNDLAAFAGSDLVEDRHDERLCAFGVKVPYVEGARMCFVSHDSATEK